jgi:hypothetical protein
MKVVGGEAIGPRLTRRHSVELATPALRLHVHHAR